MGEVKSVLSGDDLKGLDGLFKVPVSELPELRPFENRVLSASFCDYIRDKYPGYDDFPDYRKVQVYSRLVGACENCGLVFDSKYPAVPDVLVPKSPFVFVGRNPSTSESRVGEVLSEKSAQGRTFLRYLDVLGVSQCEVSVLNMCACHGFGNRPPTSGEIGRCVGFKPIELSIIGEPYVRVFFAMGNDAIYWLLGRNHPGVLQSVGEVRAFRWADHRVFVIPLVHPAHLCVNPELRDEVYRTLVVGGAVVRGVRAGL